MEKSDTFLAILDEGRLKQAKKILLSLGKQRFGPQVRDLVSTLESETELDHLDRILERILDSTGWQDLLETP